MIKSRAYIAGLIGAILTFGCCHLARAYSDNAAPVPAATPATAPAQGASPETTPTSAASPDKTETPKNAAMTSQDFDSSKNIMQNISPSASFITLSKVLSATGLDATLGGGGPLVLFAPDESAFAKIPADQLADLMKDENKGKLAKILSYHIVAGKLSFDDLEKLGATGNDIPLRTNAGSTITVKKNGDSWTVKDETGAVANITITDAKSTNGNIYVIDTVLMPK